MAVLASVQSLGGLFETFPASKLISLWIEVVSDLAEDVVLKTAEYYSSSVILEVSRLNPNIMQSQLKNNVTRILHDKAHCSRYDNIST